MEVFYQKGGIDREESPVAQESRHQNLGSGEGRHVDTPGPGRATQHLGGMF